VLLNLDDSSGSKSKSKFASSVKKPIKSILGIGALAGVIALGSTFAANINLNGGGPVEFGQGVSETTACDNSVLITPESTFVNASGSGSHMFTSLKISGIDSSNHMCDGKIFRIKAYGDSGQLDLLNYRYADETTHAVLEDADYKSIEITDTAGTFSWTSGGTDGDDLINGSTSDLTDTSFTIKLISRTNTTTRTALAMAANVKSITIETLDLYRVGDTGPGGGKIYYVAPSEFDCGPALNRKCKFLEVAPSGWNTGLDPLKAWAVADYAWGDVGDITNEEIAYNNVLGIGLGYKNSKAIVDQGNDNTTAAGLARAYAGGAMNDWYLPTTAELNLLCQWASNVTQDVTTECTGGTLNTGTGSGGGFREYLYWSSSEYILNDARLQDFIEGGQVNTHKNGTYSVRPIRSF